MVGRKILAVDYGDRRTGLAVSNELLMGASPLSTIFQRNPYKIAEEIARITQELKVTEIVVGLPKNMDNSIGFRGQETLEFVETLGTYTDVEIKTWDERLTTVSAISILNSTNVRGKKRKNVIDTVAAVLILENYLNYIKREIIQ